MLVISYDINVNASIYFHVSFGLFFSYLSELKFWTKFRTDFKEILKNVSQRVLKTTQSEGEQNHISAYWLGVSQQLQSDIAYQHVSSYCHTLLINMS